MIASHSIRCPPVSWKVVQNPRTYRLGSHNFPYDSCVDKYRHTYNQSANCCRIHFPATSMSAVVSCSATAKKLTPKVSLRNPRTRLLWTPSPCRVARRNVAAKAEVTNGNGAWWMVFMIFSGYARAEPCFESFAGFSMLVHVSNFVVASLNRHQPLTSLLLYSRRRRNGSDWRDVWSWGTEERYSCSSGLLGTLVWALPYDRSPYRPACRGVLRQTEGGELKM